MAKLKVILGRFYRDTATGFTGRATAISKSLGGVEQVRIEVLGASGELRSEWLEAKRLEVLTVETIGTVGAAEPASPPEGETKTLEGETAKEFERVPDPMLEAPPAADDQPA